MKRFPIALMLALAIGRTQTAPVSFDRLTEGQTVSGFQAIAVYLDDSDRPIGARFHHQRSGLTLDLLQIQSVPQAYISVGAYPTSNKGEPHTQEHLLLGKGNKGRAVGTQEPLSLVESSALTYQQKTDFFFYTSAGAETFYKHFELAMDALMYPDYTDEEIRREVRNIGVTVDARDGSLHLEEKGTVYNEMVTSMDQAGSRVSRAALDAQYGPEHPLAFNQGGTPEALRTITPADVRKFHTEHYFLANMTVIAALPKDMRPDVTLARIDAALNRLEPRRPGYPVLTEDKLPAPQPAPAGRIEFVEYPYRNEQQPGTVILAWPANRSLTPRESTLLGLFLSNLAGGPDTNLYKRLVDSKTREADFGITGVSAGMNEQQGYPVDVYFGSVPVTHLNDRDLASLRAQVMQEFDRVAAYADGSAELTEFNARARSRLDQARRASVKFINSPPGFGYRFTSQAWLQRLRELNSEPGFRKSITGKEDMAAIEALLAGPKNIWRDYLGAWKITGVTPFIEAAKPSAALVQQEEREHAERIAAEAAALKRKYAIDDDQAAIRRYREEYDAASAELEKVARTGAVAAKFIDHPPMTLDDTLDFKSTVLPGNVPLVSSTFDSMTSATTSIALRLDGIPEDRLVLVTALPSLLTRVGVIENGAPVSYSRMVQRLREEVLSLGASFGVNETTNRYELAVRGGGNNLAESKRALEWMKLVLFHPDWRPENLARIRDMVDQELAAVRTTTQGSEETWVSDPSNAYRRQDNPLLLSMISFMTRAHNLHRLRWMLKDGGSEPVYAFLAALGNVAGTRAERRSMLASIIAGKYPGLDPLQPGERTLVADAAHDLDFILTDIPDSSLAADWSYLCSQMVRDLKTGPRKTLAALDEIRQSILVRGGARMSLVGSTATQKALEPDIQNLAASLQDAPAKKAVYRPARRIDERLLAREPEAVHPLSVGLLNANSQGGVMANSAPLTGYQDTSREALLDALAGSLYTGKGGHGIFMKTWSAGLAYGNGLNIPLAAGRVTYYAERTPDLPQTLQFVIDELTKARPDPTLVDYAVSGLFAGTRAAQSYEARADAMANNLADGLTPDVVRRFHQAVLDLRKSPNLSGELFRRIPAVYAKVLPGMGVKPKDVEGGAYFVIGPEKQLASYEQYLKKTQGAETRLWRLYPRDYWLIGSHNP